MSLCGALRRLSSAWLLLVCTAHSQERGPGASPAPLTPRTAAQFDLTGYWVSVITQDWSYRMVTPSKGDRGSVPLNPVGRKVTNDWDPTRDVAGDEPCKAYGVASVMRRPGWLHISWADDSTLRIDLSAGQQTRLLHFSEALPAAGFASSEVPVALWRSRVPPGAPTLQGDSVAAWQKIGQVRGLEIVDTLPQIAPGQGGTLMVVTTHMKPGYLQWNGVPYSADSVLTEYFDRIHLPGGDDYLVQTSILEDPTYLTEPYVTSAQFKREPNGAAWTATPCSSH